MEIGLFLGNAPVLFFFLGLFAALVRSDLEAPLLIGAGLLLPLINGAIGMGLAGLIGMSAPNALLFTVILASGSYIVVPAALRYALPEANPGVFLPMALAVTFPFNILLGIPLYWTVIQHFWGLV